MLLKLLYSPTLDSYKKVLVHVMNMKVCEKWFYLHLNDVKSITIATTALQKINCLQK